MEYKNIILTPDIKGVLIDLDGTLYNYEVAHQKALQVCGTVFVKEFPNTILLEEFFNKYREKRNKITLRLFPQGVCRSRFFAFQEFFEEMKTPQAFNKAIEVRKFILGIINCQYAFKSRC